MIDHRVARIILFTFVLTFMAARVTVLLIMLRKIPTLYLHVSKTHVHHLNYGIFLLSLVGAYILLVHPTGKWLNVAAMVYAVGLALTFDEFGMWLHLGGPYWQRASFDAVVVIASILGLLVLLPDLGKLETRHWWAIGVLLVVLGLMAWVLVGSLRFAGERISPMLQNIEARGPAE